MKKQNQIFEISTIWVVTKMDYGLKKILKTKKELLLPLTLIQIL